MKQVVFPQANQADLLGPAPRLREGSGNRSMGHGHAMASGRFRRLNARA